MYKYIYRVAMRWMIRVVLTCSCFHPLFGVDKSGVKDLRTKTRPIAFSLTVITCPRDAVFTVVKGG